MNIKRKGTTGEQEVVSILTAAGIRAYRNDQTFVGGKDNPDVYAEIFDTDLHIECKRVEKLNLLEAVKQAVIDANGKAFPVVFHRKNRSPWLVTCRLSDLIELIQEKRCEK